MSTDETTPQQEVLIVTGMSGAGRSTVANALEDHGWYVVDNLPPQMLRPLVDLAERADVAEAERPVQGLRRRVGLGDDRDRPVHLYPRQDLEQGRVQRAAEALAAPTTRSSRPARRPRRRPSRATSQMQAA